MLWALDCVPALCSAHRFTVPFLQRQCVFIRIPRGRELAALPPSAPGWHRRCKGVFLPAAAWCPSTRSFSRGGFLSSPNLPQFFLLDHWWGPWKRAFMEAGIPFMFVQLRMSLLSYWSTSSYKNSTTFFSSIIPIVIQNPAAAPDEQVCLSNLSLVMSIFPSIRG